MSTFTPNLNLILQPRDNPDWDVGDNGNFTILDGLGGSATAGDILTSNGPGTPATFQPPAVPAGLGTVTSVALSVPSELAVAGSPITTAGTLAISKAVQNANKVWAGPTTGGDAQPTFRALVAADIPFTLPDFTATPGWWGSFEGGPFQWTGGGNGQWGVAGGSGANVVKFCMVRLPYIISISKLTYYQLSVLAGSVSGFAWYNSLGTVKLFSWDNIDTGAGGGTKTTTISPVSIPPGVYIAACSNSMSGTSPTTLQGYGTGGTNEPSEPWNSNGTIRTGVGSNVMSGGIMPATLGTLSASVNVGTSLPSITLEP
jgi:hypothetical protein